MRVRKSPSPTLQVLTRLKRFWRSCPVRALFAQYGHHSSESVEQGFVEVLAKFERLDGLVNNAGITRDQLLMRMRDEDLISC
ncbi:unnamed protein product [Sphagnum balticum]